MSKMLHARCWDALFSLPASREMDAKYSATPREKALMATKENKARERQSVAGSGGMVALEVS